MASRKPKIRFQLTANGVPKQLFAIRERSSDQLVILTPREQHIDWDGDQPLSEEHISVHGAQRGSGTTIKSTLQTKKGDLLETVQFMPNHTLGWGTVVLAKVSQDLSDIKYDLVARPHDRVVEVASHNPKTSAFV